MSNLSRMHIPESGEELDAEPVALPIGASQPTPLHVLIARMVRDHVQSEKGEGYGSIEDEDDFEEEDPDTLDFASQYSLSDVTEEPISSALLRDPEPDKIDSALSEALTGDTPDPNESEPE